MTNRRLRMLEDKHLRDSARALVEADVEHIKADFANKGMAKRALFRLRENAGELYDEALDVADSNKGAVAAVFAALIVWFARNPLLDIVGLGIEQDDERTEPSDEAAEH